MKILKKGKKPYDYSLDKDFNFYYDCNDRMLVSEDVGLIFEGWTYRTTFGEITVDSINESTAKYHYPDRKSFYFIGHRELIKLIWIRGLSDNFNNF